MSDGQSARCTWVAWGVANASSSRGSSTAFTPLKVTNDRSVPVESAALMACASPARFRLCTRTFSRLSRVTAAALSALAMAVRMPRRVAPIAVITAPPPIVAWKRSVLISSPGPGRRSSPTNTRSSNASPAVSSVEIATRNCNGACHGYIRRRCNFCNAGLDVRRPGLSARDLN